MSKEKYCNMPLTFIYTLPDFLKVENNFLYRNKEIKNKIIYENESKNINIVYGPVKLILPCVKFNENFMNEYIEEAKNNNYLEKNKR
jgi:hypothetical protein